MMCKGLLLRSFTTGCCWRAVEKSVLSQLRKKTGFSFSHCKKALEKFNNDLEKAEGWLQAQAQEEGWSKAVKLQGRPMSQGLIGLIHTNRLALMLEVNCETDFVARTPKFQNLVATLSVSCLKHCDTLDQNKALLDTDGLSSIAHEATTFGEELVKHVGVIGENMRLSRGAYLRARSNEQLAGYVHSAVPSIQGCSLGRYAAMVLLSVPPATPHAFGTQLAQHIVGMNPREVGSTQDPAGQDPDTEHRLIHQEFLLDPQITVGELLQEHNAIVHDFVRFECGQY